MSYALQTACYNCAKKDECKDSEKIRKAIDEIHQDQETHKGAGQVILMCCKMQQK